MDEKHIINSAVQYIERLFAEDHSGHDAEHSLRVYNTALSIADTDPQCNRLVVSLAALLHDADDHKLFSTENNRNARAFLEEHQVNNELIEQICDVINSVSFSKNKERCPKSIESKIVQDADRLDAIGAIGIARTFAYGGAHGRSIADSIRHFHDKLLLLKGQLNTAEGKRMGEARHRFMEDFLIELQNEMK